MIGAGLQGITGGFRAGANRDYMESIEFTKLRLEDLVTVALEEMGAISDVLEI